MFLTLTVYCLRLLEIRQIYQTNLSFYFQMFFNRPGECLAPCCQEASPEERERARVYNETMMSSTLQCPPNPTKEQLGTFMEAKGTEAMKLYFKSEGMKKEWAATHTCFLPSCDNPGAHRCSRCKKVFYCSKECSEKNWPRHKPDCKRPTKSKNSTGQAK